MKITVLFCCILSAIHIAAAEVPSERFVRIPANPDFTFARSLESRSRTTGEKAPIMREYVLGKYPVTNSEYAEFVKATRHRLPRYWRNGTFPRGKENHPVLEISYNDAIAYCSWFGKNIRTGSFVCRLKPSGRMPHPVRSTLNFPGAIIPIFPFTMAG